MSEMTGVLLQFFAMIAFLLLAPAAGRWIEGRKGGRK